MCKKNIIFCSMLFLSAIVIRADENQPKEQRNYFSFYDGDFNFFLGVVVDYFFAKIREK